jgi:hypothetical protein
MAQLILGAAGEAIGGAIGGTILGVGAAQIGGLIGAVAGSYVDGWLFPNTVKGPRLSDLSLQTSTEGASVPRIDGSIRVAGQVIWATKYLESTSTSGGKGGGTRTTTYKYSISFAVGLSQGVVHKLGRIWADGNLLDTSDYTIRFYSGSEDQTADPLIEETEGAGNTPAYRGLCYAVFEDMPLADFGNRIPQLQFELVRAITADRHADALENIVSAVNLIPGAGEFVYATEVVSQDDNKGATWPENQANSSGVADAVASLDDLAIAAPNLKAVTLIAGWFGDDLRAGVCTIRPKVESTTKKTYDLEWSVDGIERLDAKVVSYVDGYPAYGGTPSDNGVREIIAAIKARGWKITFHPFLFMDIAANNTLSNPYSGNAATVGQPAYPWRGRITCSPAAGFDGSADKTSAAATQIGAFFTGRWGYRRMVLHYANLCAEAGGVDAFLIGSELVGLTRVRSDAATYPAVTALKTLAADVKAVVGASCRVGYAADWSEWNNHQTGDAPGAVRFNLDPLWSDANIDFIGIDNYLPLADWRDGVSHLDYAAPGPVSPRDKGYLQGNIRGGEYYDWYYANDAGRDSQTRIPILDAAYGKSWVWRQKDFWNWWSNRHYDRPDGTESATATAWVPQSKPIRFAELGCPAVDKGANQPNVFTDPKSSESALPYYSNGGRDDLMQRAFLEAHLNYWADSANNPVSTVYSGPMVATDFTALWCWDARPYPFFPARTDLWADAGNYTLGHWLNGRLSAVMLGDLVAEICEGANFSGYDVDDLSGLVTGYARTSTMSARDELEPLARAFFFDAVEIQGSIRFLMRGRPDCAAVDESGLLVAGETANFGFTVIRAQDDDLSLGYRIAFIDAANGYEQGSYQAKRLAGNSNRIEETSIPLVMDRGQAGGIGDRLLQESWAGRETAVFSLPPSRLALDAADEVALSAGGRPRRFRIARIDDTDARAITATATDPAIYESIAGAARATASSSLTGSTGRALLAFMDMPMLQAGDIAYAPHLAAYADPWPSSVLLYRSAGDTGYALDTAIAAAALFGETLYDLYSGPTGRWDEVNALYVEMYGGTLSSADEIAVLGGDNALALANGDEWEIVQFRNAELTGARQWKLTGLLRGLLGSEANMGEPLAAGARVVSLSAGIVQSSIPAAQYANSFNYKWGPSDKDMASSAWQSAGETFRGVGLRPYAPCHVTCSWNAGGDLTVYWIRRDRDPAADGWDQSEIPLSEDGEAYEVEIKNADGAVLRTVTGLSVSSWLYPAVYQIADFGAALAKGSTLTVSITQISAMFGRGQAKTVTLYL